jgi:hypothetical protein
MSVYTTYKSETNGAFTNPNGIGGNSSSDITYTQYHLPLSNITDGASNTFLIGETNYNILGIPWPEAPNTEKWGDHTWAEGYWALSWGHIDFNIYEKLGIRSFNTNRLLNGSATLRVFRSDHRGGAQFVFLDSSVRFVPTDIDYNVLRALVTRAGEEVDHSF